MCKYTGRVNEDEPKYVLGVHDVCKGINIELGGTWFPKVDAAIWPQESFDF